MYKFLMYICLTKEILLLDYQNLKDEKFAIIQRKFKYHNHEIAGRKR
jgi:hypothetical protein